MFAKAKCIVTERRELFTKIPVRYDSNGFRQVSGVSTSQPVLRLCGRREVGGEFGGLVDLDGVFDEVFDLFVAFETVVGLSLRLCLFSLSSARRVKVSGWRQDDDELQTRPGCFRR